MKLRKVSTILLSSLAFVSALTLTSCGNGVANVTYVDENGTEQVQEIKKTENKDEVVDAMAAIAYSKSEEEFNPKGIALRLNARANISGIQDKKRFSEGLNANLEFRLGEVSKNDKKELCTYSKLSLDGKMNFSSIMAMINNPKSITNEEQTADLTKTNNFNISAEEFSDTTNAYFRINKLDGIPYSELGLSLYESTIKEYIGKLYYVELSSISRLIPISIPNKSLESEEDTSFDYSALINSYSSMIPHASLLTYNSGETITEYKERCKQELEDNNIVISSVSGNNVTFKFQQTVSQSSDEESKYSGNSYVALTIDSKIKMPVALDVDYGDYLTYLANSNKEEGSTNQYNYGVKFSIGLDYNASVPTLTEADKKKANDGSILVSLISMYIPRYK